MRDSEQERGDRYRIKTDLPFPHFVGGWFPNKDQMRREDAFWAGRKPALAREPNSAYTEGMIREGDQGYGSERNQVPLYKRVGLVRPGLLIPIFRPERIK